MTTITITHRLARIGYEIGRLPIYREARTTFTDTELVTLMRDMFEKEVLERRSRNHAAS
jgi:hypothetical protein